MELILAVIILSICAVTYAFIHNSIVVPAVRKKKEAEAKYREQARILLESRQKDIEAANTRRAAQREAEAQKALAVAQAKKQAEVAAFKEKKSQPVLRSSQLQELYQAINSPTLTLKERMFLLQEAQLKKQPQRKSELPDVYFDQETGAWRTRE